MGKFHITAQGPRPCTAHVRVCPLGGEHFDSLERAEHVFKAQQSDWQGLRRSVNNLQNSCVTIISPQAGGRYFGCHVAETSIRNHLDAFRDAVGNVQAELMESNKAMRDRGHVYHLTVVTPPEMKNAKNALSPFPETVKINYLGVGKVEDRGSEAWFVVCESHEIAEWRAINALEPKDLHITLGFNPKDVHSQPKGKSSLVIQ